MVRLISLLALVTVVSTADVRAITVAEAAARAQAQARTQDTAYTTEWRWAEDSWELTDDKVAHFGVGFALATVSAWATDAHSEPAQWGVLVGNAAFWSVWEAKDALTPWEKYGKVGGDGWSWADWTYSMAGATLALLIWR
jgi:hypothetical protein